MQKPTSKRGAKVAAKKAASSERKPRGANKFNSPEPLHKEKFEQLLDDAIGAKKKAS